MQVICTSIRGTASEPGNGKRVIERKHLGESLRERSFEMSSQAGEGTLNCLRASQSVYASATHFLCNHGAMDSEALRKADVPGRRSSARRARSGSGPSRSAGFRPAPSSAAVELPPTPGRACGAGGWQDLPGGWHPSRRCAITFLCCPMALHERLANQLATCMGS